MPTAAVHTTDLTKLDLNALRAFIDNDLKAFADQIAKLRTTQGDIRSLYDLGSSPMPLSIGKLASDPATGGKDIVTHLTSSANNIDAVLNKHSAAVRDLSVDLEDVIASMKKAQQDSLDQFDAEDFLNAINDYNGDMGGSTKTPELACGPPGTGTGTGTH